MHTVLKQSKLVLAGLAFWAMLAGWAAAQDGRQACPPSLAVPEECWPPPCRPSSCDACDANRSECPGKDDYFLLPAAAASLRCLRRGRIPPQPFARGRFCRVWMAPATSLSRQTISTTILPPMGHVLIGYTLNECLQIEGSYFAVARGG